MRAMSTDYSIPSVFTVATVNCGIDNITNAKRLNDQSYITHSSTVRNGLTFLFLSNRDNPVYKIRKTIDQVTHQIKKQAKDGPVFVHDNREKSQRLNPTIEIVEKVFEDTHKIYAREYDSSTVTNEKTGISSTCLPHIVHRQCFHPKGNEKAYAHPAIPVFNNGEQPTKENESVPRSKNEFELKYNEHDYYAGISQNSFKQRIKNIWKWARTDHKIYTISNESKVGKKNDIVIATTYSVEKFTLGRGRLLKYLWGRKEVSFQNPEK